MSTLSGILLGIATAAAVTVFYGDTLNQKLEQWLQSAERTVSTTTAVLEPSAEPLEQPAESIAPEPEAADSSAHAQVQPTEQPDAVLAGKWREFAGQSDSLQPVGEYPWRDCFRRASATYGVAESLLLAVASGESSFDATARSNKDAIGVMQIRWPDTSRHLGIHREADLYDPCTNVSAGAKYLAELAERYGNDLHRTVAAYNYGPGRINEERLPPGAQWYSQYIYQHLQRVLGRPHVASSELLPATAADRGGYEVLMSFNEPYRARDFIGYLHSQAPGISLAQRTEALGRYEVIVIYDDAAERQRALSAIERSGLLTLN